MPAIIARSSAIALFLLFTAGPVAAETIYRWLDETGEPHFVSDLDEVPAQYREAAVAASKQSEAEGSVNIIPGIDELPAASKSAPAHRTSSAPSTNPSEGSSAREAGEPQVVEGGDENDSVYDEGDLADDHRERARARQDRREADATPLEGEEAAERVRQGPAEAAPREESPERPRGRR